MTDRPRFVSELPVLPNDAEFKSCCAAFYDSPAVRYVLGDTWHPGGAALTMEIAAALGISSGDRVLDIACGQGVSARAIAAATGAHVLGIDLSLRGLRDALGSSADEDGGCVSYLAADAERLAFADASFDAVLCECAFCTFPVKERAASEIARVLRPGGRIALADITRVPGPLPTELSSLMARVICVGDARSLREYESFLRNAGLRVVESRDCRQAAAAFLRGIEQRLLVARIAQAVGRLPAMEFNLGDTRRVVAQLKALVVDGRMGYGYVIAEKEAGSV